MFRKHLILLILLPLFSLACALGEMAANAGRPAADPGELPSGPPPAAQPGDLHLDAAASGLSIYTSQFQAKFSGTDSQGQSVQSALLLAEEFDASQPAQHLLAKTETSGQPPASMETYQFSGAEYVVSTELSSQSGCMLAGTDGPAQSVLRPGDIILSIQRGELVQQGESLAGVLADHYKLAGLNLGVGQAETWDGEIWVAQQGGYVLRFSGWAEGQITLTGQSGSGRLEWNYVLDGAAPVNIILPDDCHGTDFSDLVLPAGAADISQRGSQLFFTSPAQPSELLDFYHASLPENGWSIDNESGTGTIFTIDASKEGRSLQVLVEAQEQTCRVTLSLR